MPTILDHHALANWVPHRGANLIPDVIELADDRVTATSRTRIGAEDPRGRGIFSRDGAVNADGQRGRIWIEPFISELLALTGIPLLTEKLNAQGHVAVFSMMSRLTMKHPAPFAGEMLGYSKITRQRSDFTVFSTNATVDGAEVFSAEVMSGTAKMADICAFPVRPFAADPGGEPVDPALFAFKPRSQRYVDRVLGADATTGTLRCAYTYPTDHPFVPGHFPGAPLMMGVTQWLAIADATWLAKRRFGLTGPVIADGSITRPDGGAVLDVRGLELAEEGGLPRITASNRIAFREPVRPGDGLVIEVKLRAGAL